MCDLCEGRKIIEDVASHWGAKATLVIKAMYGGIVARAIDYYHGNRVIAEHWFIYCPMCGRKLGDCDESY